MELQIHSITTGVKDPSMHTVLKVRISNSLHTYPEKQLTDLQLGKALV
jgi:hypothetical protein